MPGVIFVETLRRSWRSALLWSVGIALIAAIIVVSTPDVDALKQFAGLMESMPFLLQIFAGGDVSFMLTPEGFLATKFFSFALVIFAVYALLAGLNVTANEEDRGSLDIVLSLPAKRGRIVFERLLAYGLILVAMVTLTFLALWASVAVTPVLHIGSAKLFQATFNILPGSLLVLAFTALVGTALRTRGAAVAAAIILVVGSYFVEMIGAVASGALAASVRLLSFYRYYDSSGVMKNGVEPGNILVLLLVTVICVIGALWFFERRDVGV